MKRFVASVKEPIASDYVAKDLFTQGMDIPASNVSSIEIGVGDSTPYPISVLGCAPDRDAVAGVIVELKSNTGKMILDVFGAEVEAKSMSFMDMSWVSGDISIEGVSEAESGSIRIFILTK